PTVSRCIRRFRQHASAGISSRLPRDIRNKPAISLAVQETTQSWKRDTPETLRHDIFQWLAPQELCLTPYATVTMLGCTPNRPIKKADAPKVIWPHGVPAKGPVTRSGAAGAREGGTLPPAE